MRLGARLMLLTALAVSPPALAGQEGVPAHVVEAGETVLGPFDLPDGAVRVVLQTQRLVPDSGHFAFDETVTAVRFTGPDAEVLFERPLPTRVTVDGYDRSFDVSVAMLELRRTSVLRVVYDLVPSAPMTGRAVQLFGWREERFGPLGPGITGYGTFAELPAGGAPGSRSLIDGALPFDAWAGHFAVRVPLRVVLYNVGVTPAGPWDIRSEVRDLYVGELEVPAAERQVWDDAVREVMLFDQPEGGEALQVKVRPDSEVGFGPAYGRVQLVAAPGGQMVSIEAEAYRLHVVVDGHEGWVEAYDAVGLPAAG